MSKKANTVTDFNHVIVWETKPWPRMTCVSWLMDRGLEENTIYGKYFFYSSQDDDVWEEYFRMTRDPDGGFTKLLVSTYDFPPEEYVADDIDEFDEEEQENVFDDNRFEVSEYDRQMFVRLHEYAACVMVPVSGGSGEVSLRDMLDHREPGGEDNDEPVRGPGIKRFGKMVMHRSPEADRKLAARIVKRFDGPSLPKIL